MNVQESVLARSPWEPMRLEELGSLADVLQGGGGKLSIPTDDGGDAPRKPKGQDH
jgi:hypothetical protein